MKKPGKIAVTLRSKAGGVFDYREYSDALIEAEPFRGTTEVWIETPSALDRHMPERGGTVEITAC